MTHTALHRFVIGAMVGDAIGLPYEGLGRRRVRAMLADRPLRHRLLFGRGMVSDDTEHMLLTITAWRVADGDPDRFAHALAWRLRGWMACVPPACGKATAIACLKLLIGVPPGRSGVRSAGNGPAMRAGVLGLLARSEKELVALIEAASRITHTDPRATHGALAIALAARAAASSSGGRNAAAFRQAVEQFMPTGEMKASILGVIESLQAKQPTEAYADEIGCQRGISGFVMHTVPVVIHLWLSEPQGYDPAVREVIELGGDTDTTAALLGGLVGLTHLPPEPWIDRIADLPNSVGYASRLASGQRRRALDRACIITMPLRNLFFLIVVLAHAARRMAPPYG